MKVTNTLNSRTTRHEFTVEHEKRKYDVVIHCDESGKFIDDTITRYGSGTELDAEGEDGQLREDITDYIAENWDKIVKD